MPITNEKLVHAVKRIAKLMGRTAGEQVKAANGEWYPRKGTLMLFLRRSVYPARWALIIAHGGSWTAGTRLFSGTKAEIVKLSDNANLIDALSAARKMKKLKGSRIKVW